MFDLTGGVYCPFTGTYTFYLNIFGKHKLLHSFCSKIDPFQTRSNKTQKSSRIMKTLKTQIDFLYILGGDSEAFKHHIVIGGGLKKKKKHFRMIEKFHRQK